MKPCVFLSFVLFFTGQITSAQSTNALSLSGTNTIGRDALIDPSATNNPELAPPPFTTELSRPFAPGNIAPLEPKPNELRIGNAQVSGIGVEAVKTGDPLSLVNPFNPPTNSSPDDNVVRDPFNGRVNGWSVFTIRF